MLAFLFLALAQVRVSPLVRRICAVCGVLAFALAATAYADKLNFAALEKRLHNDGAPVEPSDQVVRDFSYGGVIGERIAADCPHHKTVLVTEGVMAWAISYYTAFDTAHHQAASLLAGPCIKLVISPDAYADPAATADAFSRAVSGGTWFAYTHYDDSDLAALKRVANRFGPIQGAREYRDPGAAGGAGYFEVIPRK